jgi:hypothetical protein
MSADNRLSNSARPGGGSCPRRLLTYPHPSLRHPSVSARLPNDLGRPAARHREPYLSTRPVLVTFVGPVACVTLVIGGCLSLGWPMRLTHKAFAENGPTATLSL